MKRKGFTLVELLIVIVVIGILSAMMMLSSTEAVTSAKASNIVSNLRNMKTAVLAYVADHVDDFNSTKQLSTHDILPYLRKAETIGTDEKIEGYWVINKDGVLYVACDLGNASICANDSEKTAVRNKLIGRAKTTGLKFADKADKTTLTNLADTITTSDTTHYFAVMWVR